MEPPLAVDVGQVLLEDDVLEHVLGHRRAAVDEAAETVVDDENLGVGETKKMTTCSCDHSVICITLFKLNHALHVPGAGGKRKRLFMKITP